MRVVSCVPSLTEWIADVAGPDVVVGRTKFCVRGAPHALRIGGTKTVDPERIEALKPDLVIANREENVRAQIEACEAFSTVLVTEIRTVEMAWQEMTRVAEAVGAGPAGNRWIERIRGAWGDPKPIRERVAYCVWRDPRMVAGGDTYISDVLRWWGAENAFGHLMRYPAIDAEAWSNTHIDRVLLPSEPFPFQEKHQAEFEQPTALVDGEAFSWYGSRMWHAVGSLRQFGG